MSRGLTDLSFREIHISGELIPGGFEVSENKGTPSSLDGDFFMENPMKMGGKPAYVLVFGGYLQKSLQKSRIGNWENESHLQINFSCFFWEGDNDTLFG